MIALLLPVIGFIFFIVSGVKCDCSDDNWQNIDDIWYHFASHKGSYYEAYIYCQDIGGYVANITTLSEYISIRFELEYTNKESMWVSPDTKPEDFSFLWRSKYAPGEPDNSGSCLYLSKSNQFKWRDTSCLREKGIFCKRDLLKCSNDDNSYPEIFNQNESKVKKDCSTINGKKCKIPFKYKGKIHNKCTTEGDFDDKMWCSTLTDSNGEHLGDDNWDYCSLTPECINNI